MEANRLSSVRSSWTLGSFLLCLTILPAGASGQTSVATVEKSIRPAIPLGLDLYLPVPERNPMTRAKITLGRRLFFDTILSRDRSTSCASCHDPENAFTDNRGTSPGVFGRKGTRNVPTLINRAYGETHFWDGRVESIEQQVLEPIETPHEMGMSVEEVVVRLRRSSSYQSEFEAAFGERPNPDNLARALASYVRTILSGDTPADRYISGDREAMSGRARRGLELFRGKANCSACHVGPNFSDEEFHNTGVAWDQGTLLDLGRFDVTGLEEDRGAFKTPTLRNVAQTAPYMHDGSLPTMEAVVDFYNRGGRPNPNLDADVRPLDLTDEEKAAIIAFLEALTGEVREGL